MLNRDDPFDFDGFAISSLVWGIGRLKVLPKAF